MISDFYKGTTKKFYYPIPGSPNIINDSINIYFAENEAGNSEFVLTASADVLTSGSSGISIFTLNPTITNISASNYFYEVVWHVSASNDVYILDKGTVGIKERL
jgi:hypothetical protein